METGVTWKAQGGSVARAVRLPDRLEGRRTALDRAVLAGSGQDGDVGLTMFATR